MARRRPPRQELPFPPLGRSPRHPHLWLPLLHDERGFLNLRTGRAGASAAPTATYVSGVSPTVGVAMDSIHVIGSRLSNCTITIGGATATITDVISTGEVVVTVPTGSGSADVRAYGPYGDHTKTGAFTYSGTGASPYYTDDFEDATVGAGIAGRGANGFTWDAFAGRPGASAVISTDVAHSGSRSLKITYEAESAGSDGSWAEQYFFLKPSGQGLTEVWMEWYVYFPANYVYNAAGGTSGNNNKLWALWAETYPVQPFMDLEYEGSTSSIREHINVYSSYNGGSPVSESQGYVSNNPVQFWTDNASIAGTWNRVRLHMRVGDGGADHGILDTWFNTALVHFQTDVFPFYASSQNWLRTGYVMGWANAWFAAATSFSIDDLKVYSADPGW
jgi:hypothetical protein